MFFLVIMHIFSHSFLNPLIKLSVILRIWWNQNNVEEADMRYSVEFCNKHILDVIAWLLNVKHFAPHINWL